MPCDSQPAWFGSVAVFSVVLCFGRVVEALAVLTLLALVHLAYIVFIFVKDINNS